MLNQIESFLESSLESILTTSEALVLEEGISITFDSLLREALEACAVDESTEEDQIIDEPKENVKIMDLPSSNTNDSLVVSIDSNNDSKNGSI